MRKFSPVSKMQLVDIVLEINTRLEVLEHFKKPQNKYDLRVMKKFNIEYLPVQFLYIGQTPMRDEYGAMILLDIEHGQVQTFPFQIAYDPDDGSAHSEAHTELVFLRTLCKEWGVYEYSQAAEFIDTHIN